MADLILKQDAKPKSRMFSFRLGKSSEERSPNLLKRLVEDAVSDVRQNLAFDPHLLDLLEDLALEEDQGQVSAEVDGYVSMRVVDYLKSRRRNQAVRRPRVEVLSASSLETREARVVVRVQAWGFARSFSVDMELPR